MSTSKNEAAISETRRKEIFLALVEAQDTGLGVAKSRKLIAEKFSASESQVQAIEREGLDQHWPPL